MSGLDQGIMLTNDEWEGLSEIDDAVKSYDEAINYGRTQVRSQRLSGVRLARFLKLFEDRWDSYEIDERIEDVVYRELGIPIVTFTKYSQAYRWVIDNPNNDYEIRRLMHGKPIGGSILLIAAAREGELKKKHWKQLSTAPDIATMRAVRDEVRGTVTSGHGRVNIEWLPDGTLVCYKGDEEGRHPCGYLVREFENDTVEVAVERLLGVGVIRR